MIGEREAVAVPVAFDAPLLGGNRNPLSGETSQAPRQKGKAVLAIHSPAKLFRGGEDKAPGKTYLFKAFGKMRNGCAEFYYAEAEEKKAPERKPHPKRMAGAKHNYKPDGGYVPDAATAIAIAVAVWNPIYGEEQIDREKPFTARLESGVWTVSGSLPKGMLGGVAEAEIAKDDGRILRVSHGK